MPLNEAVFRYTEIREQDGSVRPRTLKQIKSTLGLFKAYFPQNPNLSEIGTPDVEAFLKSLKAKDGTTAATKKTWNNYHSDLNQFFDYCCESGGTDKHDEDNLKKRWIMANPCENIKRFIIKKNNTPETITAKQAADLMKYVAEFKEGRLVPYFALALFTGIRTGDEIVKLANHPNLGSLINHRTKKILVTPEISKTNSQRKITIQPVLAKWLKAYPFPILPVNADRDISTIREKFDINNARGRDILRHTFISHHVAKFGSVGRTALESGNTEHIIKKHYLEHVSKRQGLAFFKIEPPAVENKVVDFKQAAGN
ncbi:site-specific integrase [Puniceicoccales bacterium CK1056]|uniref:Site-specific integrase n=1 Tax=Oceanipulchritudo coccoides TaxID=2706888 RepID=A0A6B2LYL2_9BACT|nr:site-specific integrase [Oceanipulchritudo coccoides]NDV61252.1 site-specific integrase [Oceanipulchritudo coccoides]